MSKLIPTFDYGRWGGAAPSGGNLRGGFSVAIEWFGFVFEICLGRVK